MSTVETAIEADRPVLSVMRRMAPHEMDEVIHTEVGRLRDLATRHGLRPIGDAFGVFHAPVTDDSDGPLEIVLPVVPAGRALPQHFVVPRLLILDDAIKADVAANLEAVPMQEQQREQARHTRRSARNDITDESSQR